MRQRTEVVKELTQNGYVSNTLKAIQIGIKSRYEWIGEDLLVMNDPQHDKFEYTAIAVSKCVTYEINYNDLFKIPLKARNQMATIAKIRQQVILQRTSDLFTNLQSIKQKVDMNSLNMGLQMTKQVVSEQNVKLGNRIRKMVDHDSVFKKPPSPKQLKRERIAL